MIEVGTPAVISNIWGSARTQFWRMSGARNGTAITEGSWIFSRESRTGSSYARSKPIFPICSTRRSRSTISTGRYTGFMGEKRSADDQRRFRNQKSAGKHRFSVLEHLILYPKGG